MNLFDVSRILHSSTLSEVLGRAIHVSLTRGASTTFKLDLDKRLNRLHLHIQRGSPVCERLVKGDHLQVLEDVVTITAPDTSAEQVMNIDVRVESVRNATPTVGGFHSENYEN